MKKQDSTGSIKLESQIMKKVKNYDSTEQRIIPGDREETFFTYRIYKDGSAVVEGKSQHNVSERWYRNYKGMARKPDHETNITEENSMAEGLPQHP